MSPWNPALPDAERLRLSEVRIAELEAEIERLKWMLDDLAGAFDTKEAILADLDRRWAERETP